jgi:hypothetical protein
VTSLVADRVAAHLNSPNQFIVREATVAILAKTVVAATIMANSTRFKMLAVLPPSRTSYFSVLHVGRLPLSSSVTRLKNERHHGISTELN